LPAGQNDCRSIAPLLVVLKLPIWAVEILSTKHRPPSTVGLMRYTAGIIAACFAHGQAISHDSGKIDHRRKIIDRYTVRTLCWRFHQ